MKLFQSIFGRGEAVGRYPETLIEQAIERAVDGTDPRLRLVPGYRKRLRHPVIHAADQVIALVDRIPAPLSAGIDGYRSDYRLAALFASADEMLQVFSRDRALAAFLSTVEGRGAEWISALLLARREERNILGMDLVGNQVRRDVAQVSVSFSGHHLLDPRATQEETRRFLKRRAFDHLLALALAEITEARMERADLNRQRDLLQRRLRTLRRSGLTFERPETDPPEEAGLQAELDAVTEQLATLGGDAGVLKAHLEVVAGRLEDAEHQLWAEDLDLCLGPMNIRRDPDDHSARQIRLQELKNARGARAVMLPVAIAPRDLPEPEDLVTAAQRYL